MPKARELREMDDDLLLETVRNARKELFGLRFRHATGELENTASLGAAKRDLARALTVARERGLSVESELTASE
jgi:large subunit ribosomal protein L29